MNMITDEQKKIFRDACFDKDYKTMKVALNEWKIDPNFRYEDGYGTFKTPLILVSITHHDTDYSKAKKCAQLLLEQGADFLLYSNEGPALNRVFKGEVSDKKGYYEYVKFLLEHGCPINHEPSTYAWNGINLKDIMVWGKTGYKYAQKKHSDEFIKHRDERIDSNITGRIALRTKNGASIGGTTLENVFGFHVESLADIRLARKKLIEFSKALDTDEKLLLKKLQHDAVRNDKAKELKQSLRERDTSGSKKNLRAFLKEKSEKKVSKAKTPKATAKKQAVRE